jgi:hypothetical protein
LCGCGRRIEINGEDGIRNKENRSCAWAQRKYTHTHTTFVFSLWCQMRNGKKKTGGGGRLVHFILQVLEPWKLLNRIMNRLHDEWWKWIDKKRGKINVTNNNNRQTKWQMKCCCCCAHLFSLYSTRQ